MGCDIHLYVERRVNGVWESADMWIIEPDYGDDIVEVPYESKFYKGRNYHLFAVLADVRNYLDLPSISNPRGLPDDITENPRRISDSEPEFFHTRSWLTLAEIFEYDWTIKVPNRGLLSAFDFAIWMWAYPDKSHPPYPRQRVSYVDRKQPIQRIDEKDMIDEKEMVARFQQINPDYPNWASRKALEEVITTHFPDYFVICEWHDPLYDMTPEFWSHTIPRLVHLGKPEDVRIVFWFDN